MGVYLYNIMYDREDVMNKLIAAERSLGSGKPWNDPPLSTATLVTKPLLFP